MSKQPLDREALRELSRKQWRIALPLFALAAAAIVAVWMHNERVARELRAGMYVPKPEKITPEVARLREYVRIDTSHGNEIDGAKWIVGQLARGGVRPEVIESAPGRANVYARIRGRNPGEALMLLSHIDVVPVDPNAWSHPPFAGDIAFNQLWGRGTLDMKSITVCEIEAFLDVARSGRTPEHDLILLATADEETGSAFGIRWLLEHRPDVFAGVRYAINEGGITESAEERLTYFGIEIGSKQVVAVDLGAPSREQLQQARIALEPHFVSTEPERVRPEVVRFFRELAPQRIQYREHLIDVNRTIARGEFWRLPRGYRELTQNNVWAYAVVPDGKRFAMRTFLYNLPDELPGGRIAWLEHEVAPFGVSVARVLVKNGPAPFSSEDTRLFALLRREIRAAYGPVPVGSEILTAFSSDSRFLRPRGIDCYGMWPFPVDFFQTQGIHGVDERIRIDWFVQGVGLMRKVVGAYAFEV